MARPGIAPLNTAPASAGYGRTRQAPGLDVQAPLDVNVGPSQFSLLAAALGAGAEAVTAESAARVQERIKEEEELLDARATADAYGGTVDEEQFRKSRTYARRVRVIQGQRGAIEVGEKLAAATKQFREDNPLASEEDLKAHLEYMTDALYQDPAYSKIMEDPRSAAIVREHVGLSTYQLIEADRKVWERNVTTTGRTEAAATLLAVSRSSGKLTAGDLENAKFQMASTNSSIDDINKSVTEVALALMEETEDPEALQALPARWADGSPGPRSDPTLATLIDNRTDMQRAAVEKAKIDAMAGQRINYRMKMDRKVQAGEDPSPEDLALGLQLGMPEEYLGSLAGRAKNARDEAAREAEREAAEDRRHQEQLKALEGDPWSVDASKAEDAYSREWQKAPSVEAKLSVVERAISERGVLPGIYRNYLNNVPTNAQSFGSWAGGMRHLRSRNQQVYQSLGEYPRAKFEAYEAVLASGRYSPAQAFERVQVQNEDAGKALLSSKLGQETLREMVGDNPTPVEWQRGQDIIKTFGSFSDLPRQEAIALAKRSYANGHFKKDGVLLNTAYMRNPAFVDYSKKTIARQLRKRGIVVDPDDLVITPTNRKGNWFVVRERNSIAPLGDPINADLLQKSYYLENEEEIRREVGDDAFAAAKKGLDPYRNIPGEAETGERPHRINRETQARNRLNKLYGRKR